MSFFTDANTHTPQSQPQVIDTVAIGQWITDFLLTRKGERLFDLDYGLNLTDSLFDLITPQNALTLFSQVTTQLELALPIVTVDSSASSIVPDYINNKYAINVSYIVKGITNNKYSTQVVLGASNV